MVDEPRELRARDVPLAGLATEFAALARSLSLAGTLREAMTQVTATAVSVVPGADLASVTLCLPGGGYTTSAWTDPLAVRLDELQYSSGEGPCVLAAERTDLGLVTGEGRDWPVFGPAASAEGVLDVLTIGLSPGEHLPRAGSLNLYSRAPGAFHDTDRAIATILAAHAATALAGFEQLAGAEQEAVQLREALRSRETIGQAKGILMQQRGITADEAFDLLRETSQQFNTKVADLAATLCENRAEVLGDEEKTS